MHIETYQFLKSINKKNVPKSFQNFTSNLYIFIYTRELWTNCVSSFQEFCFHRFTVAVGKKVYARLSSITLFRAHFEHRISIRSRKFNSTNLLLHIQAYFWTKNRYDTKGGHNFDVMFLTTIVSRKEIYSCVSKGRERIVRKIMIALLRSSQSYVEYRQIRGPNK